MRGLRKTKLSVKECKLRGLCYKCLSDQHFASSCTKEAKKTKPPTAATTTKGPTTVATAAAAASAAKPSTDGVKLSEGTAKQPAASLPPATRRVGFFYAKAVGEHTVATLW